MNTPILQFVLLSAVICMLFVNVNFYGLVRRSWRRENEAISALRDLRLASEKFKEAHDRMCAAHLEESDACERNRSALQERIDILEGALRERGVDI